MSAIDMPTKKPATKPKREGAAALFPERLKQLRTEREMTQAELARRLGVQRAIVSHYEHGVSLPPLPMLERLAQVHEVSLDYLVFSDRKPEHAVRDREMLQLFEKADRLDFAAKAALKQVIEGLLAKSTNGGSGHGKP